MATRRKRARRDEGAAEGAAEPEIPCAEEACRLLKKARVAMGFEQDAAREGGMLRVAETIARAIGELGLCEQVIEETVHDIRANRDFFPILVVAVFGTFETTEEAVGVVRGFFEHEAARTAIIEPLAAFVSGACAPIETTALRLLEFAALTEPVRSCSARALAAMLGSGSLSASTVLPNGRTVLSMAVFAAPHLHCVARRRIARQIKGPKGTFDLADHAESPMLDAVLCSDSGSSLRSDSLRSDSVTEAFSTLVLVARAPPPCGPQCAACAAARSERVFKRLVAIIAPHFDRTDAGLRALARCIPSAGDIGHIGHIVSWILESAASEVVVAAVGAIGTVAAIGTSPLIDTVARWIKTKLEARRAYGSGGPTGPVGPLVLVKALLEADHGTGADSFASLASTAAGPADSTGPTDSADSTDSTDSTGTALRVFLDVYGPSCLFAEPSSDSECALSVLARRGDYATIKRLLFPADLRASITGRTIVHIAVVTGTVPSLAADLLERPNIAKATEILDAEGLTPAAYAARYGDENTARLLDPLLQAISERTKQSLAAAARLTGTVQEAGAITATILDLIDTISPWDTALLAAIRRLSIGLSDLPDLSDLSDLSDLTEVTEVTGLTDSGLSGLSGLAEPSGLSGLAEVTKVTGLTEVTGAEVSDEKKAADLVCFLLSVGAARPYELKGDPVLLTALCSIPLHWARHFASCIGKSFFAYLKAICAPTAAAVMGGISSPVDQILPRSYELSSTGLFVPRDTSHSSDHTLMGILFAHSIVTQSYTHGGGVFCPAFLSDVVFSPHDPAHMSAHAFEARSGLHKIISPDVLWAMINIAQIDQSTFHFLINGVHIVREPVTVTPVSF